MAISSPSVFWCCRCVDRSPRRGRRRQCKSVLLAVAAPVGSDRRRYHLRSTTSRLAALVAWCGQICVTLILLTHTWVIAPVRAWVSSGWSGPRANDIQAVAGVAGRVQSYRRKQGRSWISNLFSSLHARYAHRFAELQGRRRARPLSRTSVWNFQFEPVCRGYIRRRRIPNRATAAEAGQARGDTTVLAAARGRS